MNTSVIYQVNITDDYPYLKAANLQNIKGEIERHIIRVINESFIHTADENYAIARSSLRDLTSHSFFWNAAQCLEKYFKAYLISKGKNIKKYGHDITKLFNSVADYDKQMTDFQFKTDIANLGYETDLLEEHNVDSFIKTITKHGSTKQRYNQDSEDYNISLIYYLDEFVNFFKKEILRESYEESFEEALSPLLKRALYYKNTYCQKECNAFDEVEVIDKISKPELGYLKSRSDSNCKMALSWLSKRMKTN